MPSATVRGARLEMSETGSGPPVVLVHGSLSDMRTWATVGAALSRSFRTVTYARRYHWPNERIPRGHDYSMDEQVEDLQAVLADVVKEPAHLVGHSYGGFLALLAAVRRPELIRTLVLAEPPVLSLFVSTPPRPSQLVKLLVRRPTLAASIIRFGATGIGPATKAAQRGDADEAIRLFGTAVLGEEVYRRLPADRMEQLRDNFIEAEFLGSGFSALSDDDVASVRHPTLLLGGEESPALFGRLLDRLEDLLPNARRASIPASSHNMHEADPDAFVREVSGFLAANETA